MGLVGGFLLFLVAVGVVLAIWAIATYNRFVSLRNLVQNAWAQIDVQLKRRHDLIPNLVESVKGAMSGEREILESVMKARASAVSAGGHPAQAAQAENILTQTLGRLFALVENYPQLKSIETVSSLMEELKTTENRIGFARQHYNDGVTRYNIAREVFPAAVIARLFSFEPAELFDLPADAAERTAPRVDLALGR